MQFAINRLDMSSVDAFARSAAKAESLGWGYGLIPCSPLLVRDPYRYTESVLILPPPLVPCLLLFDGEHDEADLREVLVRLMGTIPT